MRKGRELQNLPVIETTRGKVLGTISALLVADEHKLDGLYFLTEDRKTCFLPMERVVKIGRDAVFVQGGDEDFGLAKELETPNNHSGSSNDIIRSEHGNY